jgi:hypothetical protein
MKDVVAYVTAYHGYSERRACALTRQARSTQRKPSVRDPRTAMRLRMQHLAFGPPDEIFTLPHWNSWRLNRKRVPPMAQRLGKRSLASASLNSVG